MLQRIGRYEILDRVASGGQGTVYRARDTVLDRIVALKVINQSTEDDPAYLEALQREARLAARLDHPNITRVHDFQVEDGIPYIVMEFIPDALDRQLRGNDRLPWRRAVEIGLQTSRALQHAHDQGVVHRDIKPQNILLRETGAAAVSDFGIARAFASSTRSQTAGVMGTPAYMAPEQWAGGAVDGRLDQYGLGIVLYEIITGRPPFQGDSMEALYVQHRETPLPAFAGNLQVPAAVQQVIRRATEKSQDARYASSGEMADALEVALGRTPSGGGRSTPPPRPPPPPRQPAGSGAGSGRTGGIPSWLLFGGLGAIVMAVIAIVIAMSAGGGSGDSVPIAALPPTEIPAPVVMPADTPEPTVNIDATVEAGIQQGLVSRATPDSPAPILTPRTPTPMPTYTPYPTPTPRPTYTPRPIPTARVIVVTPTPIPRPTPTSTPRPTATPNASSYYNKGKEYQDAENWAMAVREFTRAIGVNPNYKNAYFNRGYSYGELDQDQNAIDDYTKAIQLDPNYAQAYNNRGVAYRNLGQYQTAIDDYTKAIQLGPIASRYNNRATAYSKLGQTANANADETMACSLDSKYCPEGTGGPLLSIWVTPANAVPGQAITLSGTGYTKYGTIPAGQLTMKAGTVTTQASLNAAAIPIDSMGSWNLAATFPVLEATSGNGKSSTIIFTATDSQGLVGKSDSSFKRTTKWVTLSPTTISPGEVLTITVAGFSVDNGSVAGAWANFTVTLGTTSGGSEITLSENSTFPLGADGTGVGTITLPVTVSSATHYVTVTDNAAEIGGSTAITNNTKTVSISVPKGAIIESPMTVSTGNTITLRGSRFPPNTTASTLTIGGANAMPPGGIVTDSDGAFTAIIEVPAAATGGSLSPGTQIIFIKVGNITGSSTAFSTPNPSIVITPAEASVLDTVTITGIGFNSFGTVSELNFGSASALPYPRPTASRNGEIIAEVLVPLLTPGFYTVTMSNGTNFSASATFRATAAK